MEGGIRKLKSEHQIPQLLIITWITSMDDNTAKYSSGDGQSLIPTIFNKAVFQIDNNQLSAGFCLYHQNDKWDELNNQALSLIYPSYEAFGQGRCETERRNLPDHFKSITSAASDKFLEKYKLIQYGNINQPDTMKCPTEGQFEGTFDIRKLGHAKQLFIPDTYIGCKPHKGEFIRQVVDSSSFGIKQNFPEGFLGPDDIQTQYKFKPTKCFEAILEFVIKRCNAKEINTKRINEGKLPLPNTPARTFEGLESTHFTRAGKVQSKKSQESLDNFVKAKGFLSPLPKKQKAPEYSCYAGYGWAFEAQESDTLKPCSKYFNNDISTFKITYICDNKAPNL